MCTNLHIKVKSVSPFGVKRAFVPCGKCEDCRQVLKNSWVFRLRYELEQLCSKGWKIGFFTLTYNEESLPKIPRIFFKSNYTPLPCFNKEHIRGLIVSLKKMLLRSYGCRLDKKNGVDSRLRYMICCEYGESTQRPHYHGIVCFPPFVPPVEVYNFISKYWTSRYGFIIPKNFAGDYDLKGNWHNGFICESVKAAALYAAKYCCKDLKFYESIKDFDLYQCFNIYPSYIVETSKFFLEECDLFTNDDLYLELPTICKKVDYSQKCMKLRLSNYMPFHFQSKSLGASFCDDFTDDRLRTFLDSGFSFIGDGSPSPLPVYIRNKLFFTPKYVFDENGKRLVRREARDFLKKNADFIVNKKIDQFREVINEWYKKDYWVSLGADDAAAKDIVGVAKSCKCSPVDVASYYVVYFGLSNDKKYESSYYSLGSLWLQRYFEHLDLSKCKRFEWHRMAFIEGWLSYMLVMQAKYKFIQSEQKQKVRRAIAAISDFWRSR